MIPLGRGQLHAGVNIPSVQGEELSDDINVKPVPSLIRFFASNGQAVLFQTGTFTYARCPFYIDGEQDGFPQSGRLLGRLSPRQSNRFETLLQTLPFGCSSFYVLPGHGHPCRRRDEPRSDPPTLRPQGRHLLEQHQVSASLYRSCLPQERETVGKIPFLSHAESNDCGRKDLWIHARAQPSPLCPGQQLQFPRH